MTAEAPKGQRVDANKIDQEKVKSLKCAGQKAFKAGEFESAVNSFTQALAEKKDDIALLDNRCAAYGKLKQYSLARNDARVMVKLAPTDERGYLRLGQSLWLEGNLVKAVAIYEYALTKLAEDNRGLKAINHMLKKAQDQLAGGNRRDPFTVLPLELAEDILKSLTFKEIVGILRVCKGWNQFLRGIPSLWMDVNLTGAQKRVPWTSIRNYIHQSRVALTHANIQNIVPAATPKVLDMLSRCPHLAHLQLHASHENPSEFYAKIRNFKRLKTLVCDIRLSHTCVGGILSGLPLLEKAGFHDIWESSQDGTAVWPKYLPNLKSLFIGSKYRGASYIPFLNSSVIPGLCSETQPTYPNLEELQIEWEPVRSNSFVFNTVQDAETLPPLRELVLHGARVRPNFYAKLPKSIESLRYYGGSVESDLPNRNEMDIADNELLNLKDLIFENTPWVTVRNLRLFTWASNAPIETLHVNYCHNINADDLISNFIDDHSDNNPRLRKMTNLGVAGISGIDDTSVRQICTALPDLKILELSETSITGCTIRMLADAKNDDSAMANLTGLIIKRCDDVTNDAIDYGRDKGLVIIN
ncbi:uncharacterized protein N7511_007299 [Penicillium nucicola]|uniref:uncharacterized protein n=1 Tax=Penicillium nucicola TaxID=1850975 RepID=UPI002544FC9B|nr:uncharacterized protein N7511_007299 [Penicillium nucicola]KAJ5757117.1 hypothetical protein N7511_007299 [Penicillium nucicola]